MNHDRRRDTALMCYRSSHARVDTHRVTLIEEVPEPEDRSFIADCIFSVVIGALAGALLAHGLARFA